MELLQNFMELHLKKHLELLQKLLKSIFKNILVILFPLLLQNNSFLLELVKFFEIILDQNNRLLISTIVVLGKIEVNCNFCHEYDSESSFC